MRCSLSYSVEKLSTGDSWKLFTKIAFSHGGALETETFTALGRSMIERCGGLPLAIKALGNLLHSKKSEHDWQLIKDSETWRSKDVSTLLRLSYDNLPNSSMKRCFAYCSILPKDYVINTDKLVKVWMALGFLSPPRGSSALMEDIGSDYCNILYRNSLLQDVERDEYGNITSCKMHDLALDLSKHHSVTVTDDAGKELNHVSQAIYVRLDQRVLTIKPPNLKRKFGGVQSLYTWDRILGDVLPYLNHLTVLVLSTTGQTDELPTSLCKMKYLKHLDISRYQSTIPSYICKFYNLQTLIIGEEEKLPKRFGNLIMLRHLFIVKSIFETRCIINGIERLNCLQSLPHFVVSRDQNCLVRQLGGLNNLRGNLELYGLDDIENMEEASQASLCTKSNIERLKLVWKYRDSDIETEYNDEDVMGGLKPHTNLKKLEVVYYMGRKFAWITMMTNLVKFSLFTCNRCEGFPSLGHLPKLREMDIYAMCNVKVIGSDFDGDLGSAISDFSDSDAAKTVATMYPSLTKLILRKLPKLEEWVEPCVMNTSSEDVSSVPVFPKLEALKIESSSMLKKIPSSNFSSLKNLELESFDSSSMILETMSRKLCSLTSLILKNISDGGGGASSSSNSDMDSKVDRLLKNNSLSLKNLVIVSSMDARV